MDESAPGQGYGTALMLEEAIARARSGEVAFLSTMTFQAPDFYRKCGYAPFGELVDSPKGSRRNLDGQAAGADRLNLIVASGLC